MTRPRFITKIDWNLLKKQKQSVLDLVACGILTTATKNDIDGIIHLIDALQDYAVDVMGLSEEEVFGR